MIDSLVGAYVELIRLPVQIRLEPYVQSRLAYLRDEIAWYTGKESEDVQTKYERS